MFLRTRAYTNRLSVFANWPYLKKSKLYQSLRQEAVLQLGSRWLPMVSSWETRAVSSLMIAFQGDGSQILEKDSHGVQNWQQTFKKMYTSKEQRINLRVCLKQMV